MSSVGMFFGGLIVATPPFMVQEKDPTLIWWPIILGVMTIIASALTFIGLWNYRKTWQAGVEQLGLWLSAGVAASYVWMAAHLGFNITLPLVCLGTLAAGCVLRARAIQIDQQDSTALLRATNDLREEVAKYGGDSGGAGSEHRTPTTGRKPVDGDRPIPES